MADWSPSIANEFLRLAKADGRTLTQMQLQKLVYISHGWTLAIYGERLTSDDPQAWDYGPVYKSLWQALKRYGTGPVTRDIRHEDYTLGHFEDDPSDVAVASLSQNDKNVIDRVYKDYGRFHGFQLSALTHAPGTPWSVVYADGKGKQANIPTDMIKDYFVQLARGRAKAIA